MRHRGFDSRHRVDQIDIQCRVKSFTAQAERQSAGIRHQNVDTAKCRCSAFDPIPKRCAVPHIHRASPGCYTFGRQRLDRILNGFRVTRTNRDVGSFCCKAFGNGTPDPPTCAGHECLFSGELQVHFVGSICPLCVGYKVRLPENNAASWAETTVVWATPWRPLVVSMDSKNPPEACYLFKAEAGYLLLERRKRAPIIPITTHTPSEYCREH